MKFKVDVMPRQEALDPQGRAVQLTLEQMGFKVSDCRIGKTIVLEVTETNPAHGLEKAKEIAERLLANPLIETFEVYAL